VSILRCLCATVTRFSRFRLVHCLVKCCVAPLPIAAASVCRGIQNNYLRQSMIVIMSLDSQTLTCQLCMRSLTWRLHTSFGTSFCQ
jgi:hypothetical protein